MAEIAHQRHPPPSGEPILSVEALDGKIFKVCRRTAILHSGLFREKAPEPNEEEDVMITVDIPSTGMEPIISFLNLKALPSLSKYMWNADHKEEERMFTNLSLLSLNYVLVAANKLDMPYLVQDLIRKFPSVLEADEKAVKKEEVKTEYDNTEDANTNTTED